MWDLRNGIRQNSSTIEGKEKLPPLPSEDAPFEAPPFLAIRVSALPLSSPIEWQALGIGSAEDGSISTDTQPSYGSLHMRSIRFRQKRIATIGVPLPISDSNLRAALEKLADPVYGATFYHMHVTIYTTKPALIAGLNAQIVPCEGIWGEEGKELAAAAVKVLDGHWSLS